jgi:hypothetical protein
MAGRPKVTCGPPEVGQFRLTEPTSPTRATRHRGQHGTVREIADAGPQFRALDFQRFRRYKTSDVLDL